MPALPGWYARLPEILASLDQAPPFLDRPAFERLFGVSRRQAIRLMGTAGGYQVGKTFLVDRESLINQLRQIQITPEARSAQQRKERILQHLRQRIPKPATVGALPSAAFPGVVKTGPGSLLIHYDSAPDLLGKIAALATAAAEDYPRFRETFE